MSKVNLKPYFGTRNKRSFEPKVGQNYTTVSLTKMATRNEADQIRDAIVAFFDQPFSLSIQPPGAGDLVFAFAESPYVDTIYVSEPNSTLRTILSKNLSSYGFRRDKVVFTSKLGLDQSSVYVGDLIKDPALNIDNILGQSKETKDIPLFAFRVNTTYPEKEKEGFLMTSIPLGGSSTEDRKSVDPATKSPRSGDLVRAQSAPEGKSFVAKTKPSSGRKSTEEQSSLSSASSSKLILYQRQAPVETQEETIDVDEEWLDGLITFLNGLLSNIIPEDKDRELYFTESRLGYWVQAFTHKTIDLNDNYEVLEMLGDRAMKFAFADYMIQRIVGIKESQLTELQNYYLTTIPQANMAKKYGFGQYIRIVKQPREKVLEDVLESFFGALMRVSEDVASGYGYYNVFAMISFFYRDEDIENKLPELSSGQAKTVVTQSFPKLHLPNLIEDWYQENDQVRFVLKLPLQSREYFEAYGIILPSVIGQGVGVSKKVASKRAYEQALKILRQNGVTPEWIEMQQATTLFNRDEFKPYIGTARERLKKEGYVKMSFSSPVSTINPNECVVQLIGHRANGSRSILETIVSPSCDQRSGQIEALRKYASGN